MDIDEFDRSMVLDGNAVAGLLMEVFGAEMTADRVECATCGQVQMVGALMAFTRAPGTVLRCRHCQSVMLSVVQTPRGNCLDVQWVARS